jgi:hypothetical protein
LLGQFVVIPVLLNVLSVHGPSPCPPSRVHPPESPYCYHPYYNRHFSLPCLPTHTDRFRKGRQYGPTQSRWETAPGQR